MVAMETGPADEPGMRWAAGIVTAYGGLASHAAIYSRGLGLPAVCGVETLTVEEGHIKVGETVIPEGDVISIDGASGEVFEGEIEISDAAAPDELTTLLEWADELRSNKVQVWANADTEEEATEARSAGATGIGLCRTEHMFLGDRLPVIRQLLKATDPDEKKTALEELQKRNKQISTMYLPQWTASQSPSGCSTLHCMNSSKKTKNKTQCSAFAEYDSPLQQKTSTGHKHGRSSQQFKNAYHRAVTQK